MATDPVCGMKVDEGEAAFSLRHGGETVYFCSRRCMEKYMAEHDVKPDVGLCDSCVGVPWHRQRIFIVSLVFAFIFIVSYLVPPLNPLNTSLIDYVELIWWAVLLGLLIGGVIDYFIPRQYISQVLSDRGEKTILHAVVLGFLMSACSHGILAIAIQLYRKGASIPAVIAFLMASPWANLTYTILLFSLFGVKAFYIIVSAIVIALITGIIYQVLDRRGLIEANPNTLDVDDGFSIRGDVKKKFREYSFKPSDIPEAVKGVLDGGWSLATMVVWWILIGVLAASAVGAYVPSHIFMSYLGPTTLGLIITLAAATIIEVCSEGSSPIAFEIYRQTGALGNSFVFLMAGVATDYTEIGLLWHNIGKKTALWLPVIAGPQIILLGYLFNTLL
jgi:uncharacterized membrane protein YraQ (UPF0718 family)/YHS domain-containing protein